MTDTGIPTRRKITPEEVAIVIPARMESTRLPGKPLREVRGKPMILWALEAAQAAEKARYTVVVTDSLEVKQAVTDGGGVWAGSIMPHPTGSDRIAAFVSNRPTLSNCLTIPPPRIIVNLQCDEPDVTGADLDQLIGELVDHSMVQVATYRCPWDNVGGGENWDKPVRGSEVNGTCDFSDVVKVVCDRNNNALYFSRAGIPGDVHVGVYAYRRKILESFARYPRGDLEKAEDLEQLRLLENGIPIRVLDLGRSVRSVNTEADLEAVNDAER